MSVEENKANVKKFVEKVYNKANWEMIPEIMTQQFAYRSADGDVIGLEKVTPYFKMWHNAFPDVHATINNLIAEGDMVVALLSFEGTLKGKLGDIDPTGKHMNMTGAFVSRHDTDGKQIETWQYVDYATMYKQLGVK